MVESYTTAARYYAKSGRFEEAARVLEQCLRIEERGDVHFILADVFRRLERHEKAILHLRRAREMRAEER